MKSVKTLAEKEHIVNKNLKNPVVSHFEKHSLDRNFKHNFFAFPPFSN